jgi:hypothetical protein
MRTGGRGRMTSASAGRRLGIEGWGELSSPAFAGEGTIERRFNGGGVFLVALTKTPPPCSAWFPSPRKRGEEI